jgi:hypothetical protein
MELDLVRPPGRSSRLIVSVAEEPVLRQEELPPPFTDKVTLAMRAAINAHVLVRKPGTEAGLVVE